MKWNPYTLALIPLILLALLLCAGCQSFAHPFYHFVSGSGGIVKPTPNSQPPGCGVTATDYFLVKVWAAGFIAVIVGAALIIWTPFKIKGGETVLGGILVPVVTTWVSHHAGLIALCVIAGFVIWYFSTHAVARMIALKEIAALKNDLGQWKGK